MISPGQTKVLQFLISPGQTAHIDGRFIGKSGRLIADILETTNLENIKSYLLAIDSEKAIDSLNHKFLIAVLEKYAFGNDFIDWIKMLLENQKSCIIDGSHITDPTKLSMVQKYLTMNVSVQHMPMTKLFLKKDISSVEVVFSVIDSSSKFSGMCPNTSKCEIAGIDTLKNVIMTLCGIKNVDLTKESIKILGVYISYNKKTPV